MRTGHEHQPREAEEVRPRRPGDGPRPKVHVYPYGQSPMLRLRAGGGWQTCPVRARYDFPDGRFAYQVDVHLMIDGQRAGTTRLYWWTPDPEVMRPLRPGCR